MNQCPNSTNKEFDIKKDEGLVQYKVFADLNNLMKEDMLIVCQIQYYQYLSNSLLIISNQKRINPTRREKNQSMLYQIYPRMITYFHIQKKYSRIRMNTLNIYRMRQVIIRIRFFNQRNKQTRSRNYIRKKIDNLNIMKINQESDSQQCLFLQELIGSYDNKLIIIKLMKQIQQRIRKNSRKIQSKIKYREVIRRTLRNCYRQIEILQKKIEIMIRNHEHTQRRDKDHGCKNI
ncbi:hypothetical protein pb186bvf_005349 [Paramecium bursaria]